MADTSRIKDALSKLDLNNDNHWTAEGLPRIDIVKLLAGDQSLTREDITRTSPEFTRDTAAAQVAPQTESHGNDEQAPIVAPAAPAAPVVTETNDEPAGDLQAAVNTERTELDRLSKVAYDAQQAVTAQQEKLNDALNALHATGEGETNAQAIQGYLQGQLALREQRAKRAAELRNSGVDLKALRDMVPQRSPLDIATANRKR